MLQIFEEQPLASLGSDKDKVFIEVNRGRSVRLFNNPHHKEQVRGALKGHSCPQAFHKYLAIAR